MQQVLQSRPLPDLDQVLPFTPQDEDCLREVAEVLEKHNSLKRFGVTLLHQHFPVGDDEVMLETNNPDDRTLRMQPIKISDLEGKDARTTSWRLDTGKPLMACVYVKSPHGHEHHSRG